MFTISNSPLLGHVKTIPLQWKSPELREMLFLKGLVSEQMIKTKVWFCFVLVFIFLSPFLRKCFPNTFRECVTYSWGPGFLSCSFLSWAGTAHRRPRPFLVQSAWKEKDLMKEKIYQGVSRLQNVLFWSLWSFTGEGPSEELGHQLDRVSKLFL